MESYWKEWLFMCDCWKEKKIEISRVIRWQTKSCWCLRHKKSANRKPIKDLLGKKYQMLTIIWDWPTKLVGKQHKRYLLCKCECWIKKFIDYGNLIWKRTKSCWCANNFKRVMPDTTKHGMYQTRLYNIRHMMKQRCLNSNHTSYKHYGWRWIEVCNDRLDFELFYKEVWESYEKHVKEHWERETTIDRIDNDWNYEPSNYRRATLKQQQSNKRNHNQHTKQD